MVSSVERREPFIQKPFPVGFHLLLGKMKLIGAWRNTGGFPHLTLLGSYDRFYVSLLGLLRVFIYHFVKILAICAPTFSYAILVDWFLKMGFHQEKMKYFFFSE